jgi:hypothetical protein
MPISARLCVYAAIEGLAACGRVPGFDPLFGPDPGITVVAVIAVIVYWRERLRRRKATTGMAEGEQAGGSPELRIQARPTAAGPCPDWTSLKLPFAVWDTLRMRGRVRKGAQP